MAKLYAYWITVNYREAYGIYACNGILFNHESPVRGETFVTRKITRALARIALGLEDCLYLGNLDARRDWGHAKDYVRAMWLMLQQPAPEDFVIATGEQHSVREFVTTAAREARHRAGVGRRRCRRSRTRRVKVAPGRDARCCQDRIIVRIDRRYFRPAEVDTLLGDATKARIEARLGHRKCAFPSWSRKWCARTCAGPSAMPSSSGTGTQCTSATMARANAAHRFAR